MKNSVLLLALLISCGDDDETPDHCEGTCDPYADGFCAEVGSSELIPIDSSICIPTIAAEEVGLTLCGEQTCTDGSPGCQLDVTISSDDGVWDAMDLTLSYLTVVETFDGDIRIQFSNESIDYDCNIGLVLPSGGLEMTDVMTLDEPDTCGFMGRSRGTHTFTNGDELTLSVTSEDRVAPLCGATEALLNEQIPKILVALEGVMDKIIAGVTCAECPDCDGGPQCVPMKLGIGGQN